MAKKLLLADDSITIQKVVGITFAQEDFDITYVDNGLDAINKVEALMPDIILADIVMPQKNGYDVCEAVKKNPNLKQIPVLLLAGTFETFDVNRGKLVGADDYIIKPFESQALIDKVNQLLKGKGAGTSTAAPAKAPASVPAAATTHEIEMGEGGLGGEAFGSEEVSAATDFAFDLSSASANPEMQIAGPHEVTEASPVSKSKRQEPEMPMVSTAEIMMDMVPQSTPSEGVDLPADDFGGGDDPFGLGGTPSGEEDVANLDLPPLPDESGSTSAAGEFSQGMSSLAAAPQGVVASATHALPHIPEAQVKQMVAEKVKEVLEKVAWEVIPDLAERLIQEEIRRLVKDVNSK